MNCGYFGKYTGIVKNNADDRKLGHIDVVVPAIFGKEEIVTARPALPFGWFFIPEPGSKVWIEFEGGESGLPLWTGIQYMTGEFPNSFDLDPPEKRIIGTPSGHWLIFNDKEDQEAIEILEAVHSHVVTLNKDGITIEDGVNSHRIELAPSGITVTTGGGAKLELVETGVTVDSGGTPVTVKGNPINLSSSASAPVLRAGLDQGIGNLGAPVPLIGLGNMLVLA